MLQCPLFMCVICAGGEDRPMGKLPGASDPYVLVTGLLLPCTLSMPTRVPRHFNPFRGVIVVWGK